MAHRQTRKRYSGRPDMPVLMTVRQFASHIGRGEHWVRDACKDGRILACQKVGHFYVIAQDTLIRPRWMEGVPLDVDLPDDMIFGAEPIHVDPPVYKEVRKGNKKGMQKLKKLPSFRKVMDEKGYTYAEIRYMTGLGLNTIGNARNGGQVTMQSALRLANALEVDISELLRSDVWMNS
jgi:hypothetical protein